MKASVEKSCKPHFLENILLILSCKYNPISSALCGWLEKRNNAKNCQWKMLLLQVDKITNASFFWHLKHFSRESFNVFNR